MKSWALAIVLGMTLAGASAAEPPKGVFKDDRAMGNPKAPVVLIEYASPQCPHCAHFAETVFPEVKKAYIDTGKVYYVLRIYPLSELDGAVAGLAKCAKNYFAFIDLAFKNQAIWDPDGYEIPDIHAGLVKLGGLAGIKPDQVERCIDDKNEQARVNRIAQDGVDHYDVKGVPTLVVNGIVVQAGDTSWDKLKPRIDALLQKTGYGK